MKCRTGDQVWFSNPHDGTFYFCEVTGSYDDFCNVKIISSNLEYIAVDYKYITIFKKRDRLPCECGSLTLNHPGHSYWCKYED